MMKRFIIVICFLVKTFAANAQTGFKIFDSILDVSRSDYFKSKKMFSNSLQTRKVPGNAYAFFLEESFKNNDSIFFKIHIANLIAQYGIDLSSEKYTFFNCNYYLNNGHLKKWYSKIFRENYLLWLSKNYWKLPIIERINTIYEEDQKLRKFVYQNIFSKEPLLRIMDSCVQQEDLKNFKLLIEICNTIGELPTHFEYPSIYNKIEIIVFHNLKSKNNFDTTWKLIYPFFEKSFLKGHISNDFCKMYDLCLNMHLGVQYYGTLPETIGVLDPKELHIRRKKFKL